MSVLRASRLGLMTSLVLLATLSPALAQQARTLESGAASAVGMDDARLQQGVKLYRDAVEKGELRGAVVLVARHGKIVLHEALGWKNAAYQLPMEKDTLFQMASNTKPITATAILMLEDEGKLSIQDPIATYLDSFDNDKSRSISIFHLLSHSSGFRIQPIFYPFDKDDPHPTLRKAVDKFGKEGAAVPAGTSYSYSNAGFNVLGALVEAVSGMPYEDFLVQRLYKPLGMRDTLNHMDPAKLDRAATVYRGRANAHGQLAWTPTFTPGDPPRYPVVRASGGLVSTAMDYAAFLQMYLDRGLHRDGRLLSAAAVKKGTTPYIKVGGATTPFGKDDGSYSYGLGWFITPHGVFSHYGSDGTYGWVDPAHDVVGVVLTQSPGGENPRQAFQRLVQESVNRP